MQYVNTVISMFSYLSLMAVSGCRQSALHGVTEEGVVGGDEGGDII